MYRGSEMINTDKLNYITKMMLKAYATNIQSEDWLQTKANELAGYETKCEALRELSSMDVNNLATFAELLDVSVEDLNAVKRVLRNV
jgi:hypothetical protein